MLAIPSVAEDPSGWVTTFCGREVMQWQKKQQLPEDAVTTFKSSGYVLSRWKLGRFL